MREIADLHAGTLDDAPVAFDQRVDLADERLDFPRERALQFPAPPPRMSSSAAAHGVERPQPEQNGAGVDQQAAEPEDRRAPDRGLPVEGVDRPSRGRPGCRRRESARHGRRRRARTSVSATSTSLPKASSLAIEALVADCRRGIRRCPARGRSRPPSESEASGGELEVAERLDDPVPAGLAAGENCRSPSCGLPASAASLPIETELMTL